MWKLHIQSVFLDQRPTSVIGSLLTQVHHFGRGLVGERRRNWQSGALTGRKYYWRLQDGIRCRTVLLTKSGQAACPWPIERACRINTREASQSTSFPPPCLLGIKQAWGQCRLFMCSYISIFEHSPCLCHAYFPWDLITGLSSNLAKLCTAGLPDMSTVSSTKKHNPSNASGSSSTLNVWW